MKLTSAPRTKSDKIVIVVCGLISVLIAGYIVASGVSFTPPIPNAENAWIDCRVFVRQNLKAPSTAEFPSMGDATIVHLSNDRWSVNGYVDAQNSFGAKLRSIFICQVSYSGSNAVLHKLMIGNQILLDE